MKLLPLAAALFLAWSPAAAAPAPALCAARVSASEIEACDAAIAAASGRRKAQLLQSRAYAWNEIDKGAEALRDLDAALALYPDFPHALHERAYTRAELGDFAGALADLDREIALRPDFPSAYKERAFVRHALGDLGGAFEDRSRVVALMPKDPDARLARSEAALWLGRFDAAAADVGAALRRARSSRNEKLIEAAKRQGQVVALWRTRSGSPPAVRCEEAFESARIDAPQHIGDCTAAFLAARLPSEKAEYLTYRSLAWIIQRQDDHRALADAEVAAALDPDNLDMLSNVASIYNRVGRYQAALRRLDRPLAGKDSHVMYSTRAAAKHGLGDAEGAFRDAARSVELRPNGVALITLGDVALERGDRASAKLHWMNAYRLGTRDDGLTARLKSVGVEDPDNEKTAE